MQACGAGAWGAGSHKPPGPSGQHNGDEGQRFLHSGPNRTPSDPRSTQKSTLPPNRPQTTNAPCIDPESTPIQPQNRPGNAPRSCYCALRRRPRMCNQDILHTPRGPPRAAATHRALRGAPPSLKVPTSAAFVGCARSPRRLRRCQGGTEPDRELAVRYRW